jgi:UDP-N-acetylmuramoyl-tripeptide--D-alanyl-D-alanine ligase
MASAPLPDNQASFQLDEIARVTGGTVSGGALDTSVLGVTTDSRGDVRGKLFVALRGERFDGHRYAKDVISHGAAAVLAESDLGAVNAPVIRVGSTLAALGALAQAHRARWAGKLIAIGGSAGKTTTRSAVGSVLSALAPGAVHQTAGNLNNLIGVPLVLLGLTAEHHFAVVEIGTNLKGEVAEAARLAEPDVGVLTLIGIEHSEGLGDLDAIEEEERALFAALGASGTAIGNGDDPRVTRCLTRSPARRRLRYGFGQGLEVRGVRHALAAGRQRLRIVSSGQELELELGLLGAAGAYAALAAVSVAGELMPGPLDALAIQQALETAGEPGRLKLHELANGTVVVDDAYNANPASALSSLDTARELAEQRSARLVLVFGEMRELGPLSAREHTRLGEEIGRSGAAELIAVSGDARLYLAAARAAGVEACFAPDAETALVEARARVRAGDVVLVKASRGVRAERVVEGLLAGGAAS